MHKFLMYGYYYQDMVATLSKSMYYVDNKKIM